MPRKETLWLACYRGDGALMLLEPLKIGSQRVLVYPGRVYVGAAVSKSWKTEGVTLRLKPKSLWSFRPGKGWALEHTLMLGSRVELRRRKSRFTEWANLEIIASTQ